MRSSLFVFLIALLAVLVATSSFGLERFALRESDGPTAPAGAPVPCSLGSTLDGTCANYK